MLTIKMVQRGYVSQCFDARLQVSQEGAFESQQGSYLIQRLCVRMDDLEPCPRSTSHAVAFPYRFAYACPHTFTGHKFLICLLEFDLTPIIRSCSRVAESRWIVLGSTSLWPGPTWAVQISLRALGARSRKANDRPMSQRSTVGIGNVELSSRQTPAHALVRRLVREWKYSRVMSMCQWSSRVKGTTEGNPGTSWRISWNVYWRFQVQVVAASIEGVCMIGRH